MIKRIIQFSEFLFILIWLLLFRPLDLGGPASYINVSGISMQPTLYDGDLAILQKRDTYLNGEIIAFIIDSGIVIHRIVGGSASEGFLTQGDNKTGTDPWEPREEDILGRLWIKISGGGYIIEYFRQPTLLVAIGGFSLLLMIEDPIKKKKYTRRGRRMKLGKKTISKGLGVPNWTLSLLVLTALFTLAMVAFLVFSFLQPIERTNTIESSQFEHNAKFEYTIHTEPSTLYPSGVIESVDSIQANLENFSDMPFVFTNLARSLDLDFTYEFISEHTTDIVGELTSNLVIKAGENGWTQITPIGSSVQFTNSPVSSQISLDFSQIHSLIDSVEEETGFRPRAYEVSIVPSILLETKINGETHKDSYYPEFKLKINQTQITLPPELKHTETMEIMVEETRPNEIKIMGFTIPVTFARVMSIVGLIICIGLFCLILLYLLLGPGLNEEALFHTRYRNMIVSVSDVNYENHEFIQVASKYDLVRLAQRDGRVILHELQNDGSNLYFIPDGNVIYTSKSPRIHGES